MKYRENNRPAIALATRRSLQRWRAQGWLDDPSASLIERVLDKSRPGSLSLWVHDLALELGAPLEAALDHASAAELLYGAIDFTDDVEDGDAGRYLPDVSLPVSINVSAHLFVLAWRALSELDAELSAETAARVSGMFCGQRGELTREGWSIEAYERMARATGGLQMEAYARIAAHAARVDAEPLVRPAGALGVMMHLAADMRSGDPRLMSLPESEREGLLARVGIELDAALRALPSQAVERMRSVIPRIETQEGR